MIEKCLMYPLNKKVKENYTIADLTQQKGMHGMIFEYQIVT